MDAAELSKVVAELKELSAGEGGGDARVQQIKTILTRLKSEVTPTEDLLRSSKAGVAVGKLRTHSDGTIQALSKDIVKQWKETIDENKRKRKRDDGDAGGAAGVKKEEGDKDVKRVKAEGSNAGSPSGSDTKPKKEATGTPKSDGGAQAKQEQGRGGQDRDHAEYRTQSPPSRPKLSTIDSTRTVPRTAKMDGNAASLRATPDDGDEIRHKIVVQFYDALAGDSTAEKKILVERAQAIEKEVWQKFNGSTANDYRQKCRSLFLNLKDKGNPALRNEIVLGAIGADKVVNMSKEEMASESVRAMNEKIASENLFKAKAVGETQAETDAFKCGRCQQRKCTYYQMQTRSADEPMTTFVSCTNCGNKWKFS